LPVLVKLLDAADTLSVQVHPADDDPRLAPDESGKSESWIVLDADAGAGIWLGLAEGARRKDVEECLKARRELTELLNFVTVAAGDVLLVPAGVPHAIGRGITLVEPQHVAPGKRAVTYRYWDWNRRYDAQGNLSASGELRPLHVEQSLRATDWQAQRGAELVQGCRPARRVLQAGPLERAEIVAWPWFAVEHWTGTGSMTVPSQGCLLAVSCVGGSATLSTDAATLPMACGQSAVVPASANGLAVVAEQAQLVVTRAEARSP